MTGWRLAPLVVTGALTLLSAAGRQEGPVWKSAEAGRVLRFPADHAAHPDYRIEWWYYTGNLATGAGRRFGYQLTFFRVGVEKAPANPSRWAVRDLYLAHLALTDAAGRRYVSAEKLSRAGVSWAGASADRYHVWNEKWTASRDGSGRHLLAAASASPAFSLDLVLDEGKPPVLHGENGFSRKGAQPGNASHYYSLTRMPTRGVLTLDYARYDVTGSSWMDHEFGTSFLEAGQLGWDWFSLQLDDGTELMVYGMRTAQGLDERSSGTFVDASGRSAALTGADFVLQPTRSWKSADSGTTYPVEWRVQVPSRQIDLTVRPLVDGQEMRSRLVGGLAYWEGAIVLSGTTGGRAIGGRGYLEMTGYGGPPMGQFLTLE
jgi:predicted secreted hydrolase